MLNHTLKICCSIALLGASQSYGASLNVSNVTGGPGDVAVLNSAGTPITPGFSAIFQFTSAPGNAVALQGNGDVGLLQQIALGGGTYVGDGAFATVFGSIPNNPGTAAGGPLYVVFGNGADVASSSELGMLSLGISLDGDDTPSPDTFPNYSISTSDAVIGTTGNRSNLDWSGILGPSFNARTLDTIELAVVPEPSAGILSLFGVALLFRRRR